MRGSRIAAPVRRVDDPASVQAVVFARQSPGKTGRRANAERENQNDSQGNGDELGWARVVSRALETR